MLHDAGVTDFDRCAVKPGMPLLHDLFLMIGVCGQHRAGVAGRSAHTHPRGGT